MSHSIRKPPPTWLDRRRQCLQKYCTFYSTITECLARAGTVECGIVSEIYQCIKQTKFSACIELTIQEPRSKDHQDWKLIYIQPFGVQVMLEELKGVALSYIAGPNLEPWSAESLPRAHSLMPLPVPDWGTHPYNPYILPSSAKEVPGGKQADQWQHLLYVRGFFSNWKFSSSLKVFIVLWRELDVLIWNNYRSISKLV